MYKTAIRRQRVKEAREAVVRTWAEWRESHLAIASALEDLTWKRLQKLDGVTVYQLQNLQRLKAKKLRVWTGTEKRFQCLEATCSHTASGGEVRLVWNFAVAVKLWKVLLDMLGIVRDESRQGGEDNQEVIKAVFSMMLDKNATVDRGVGQRPG
ncbi:hypothetical protein V7S43_010497 [Phytophthora oleae]|uniref:Uncharacterized protein n=1 Tax=Phytophthora oleae TaxID=2107226 RepID=A0ABD3FGT9_9STRA